MMSIFDMSDVLYDAIRAKNMCENDEWDEHKKLLNKNIANEYENMLHTIFEKAKNNEQKRKNNTYGAPSCVKVEKAKNNEHERKNNAYGAPSCTKVESISAKERETERRRKKMRISVERENESDDDSVQILDNDAIQTRGAKSSFVPSNRYCISDDESEDIGELSVAVEFRRRVLEVIGKSYNKEEYKRLGEALRDGNYCKYYHDLQERLAKERYNKRKRLAIIRGFFFWLQNVSQEGSFKPWNDGQCLGVEPPTA